MAGCLDSARARRCSGCCAAKTWRQFRAELGVTAATLTNWHDAFLAAGEAALTTRAVTGEELESDRLKARLGAALIERDLLNEKIALLESDRPFVRRRRKS